MYKFIFETFRIETVCLNAFLFKKIAKEPKRRARENPGGGKMSPSMHLSFFYKILILAAARALFYQNWLSRPRGVVKK